ncbi:MULTISPECIES: SMI1/KNR4 family protein [Bacillus]|uniref:SMI1/KNR4 family protein n=1 Tax=Bacillus TaxID=1386 RepID=UPI0001A13BB3|nr:SMI1/KNR4 family protein [Bacillus pseudomycoides]EEM16348.1 SMI1 / KNR4 [Bacillus pseudomycoides DSM 12442]MED1594376.1 SMI1/KNR4 family protein [Bacillus pseudomycoides]MED4714062.1 SMI1/KNR4 family protein [Bacillus pseudomycoides]OOR49186.1 1,3-beta-glucan synthase regulator [Bacillus pseudomycoides]PDY09639.1 SMI1/KNR4 family protein [Bacillus pseudomycoides]
MRDDLKWLYPDKEVSEEVIKKFAENLKIVYPNDYIQCVKKYGGAIVEPSSFDVKNNEEGRVFGSLCSFDKNATSNIYKTYSNLKSSLPNQIIPFADDPAGNKICFDYKNHEDNPIVVFWDHEESENRETLIEEGLSVQEADEVMRESIYYIADSFTSFLDMLYKEE